MGQVATTDRQEQRRREAVTDALEAIAYHEAALGSGSPDDPERSHHVSELAYWRKELARLRDELAQGTG